MTEVQGEAALGISMNAQISGTRQLVFQTHIPANSPQAEIDLIVDKLNDVVDRTEAFYLIPVYKIELERAENVLKDLQYRLDNVDANARLKYDAENAGGQRRKEFKLSPQEQTHKVQAQDQVRVATRNVEECKQRLEETIKKAGTRYGSAADRPTGVPDRQVP